MTQPGSVLDDNESTKEGMIAEGMIFGILLYYTALGSNKKGAALQNTGHCTYLKCWHGGWHGG